MSKVLVMTFVIYSGGDAMEWREAIIYVLGRPGRAMHYVHEITKEILDEQLVDQRSANPRQTVSNRLTTSITGSYVIWWRRPELESFPYLTRPAFSLAPSPTW